MALMKLSAMFEVCGAKIVGRQKIKVKPVERHYERDGEPEYIKYGCPLCEDLGKRYREIYSSQLFDEEKQFKDFSIPKGIANCPVCGINIDWNYKVKE